MNYLISGLIISLIIPIWGVLIYLINTCLYRIIAKVTSEKVAMIIVNWLTVPGVIHHELAHASLAVITGAHITEFRPFWPDRYTGSLGHVNFVARGPLITRCLQYTLISAAPVLLGSISTIVLVTISLRASLTPTMLLLLYYMAFSVFIHASMSLADVKIMLRGIWVLYMISTAFCIFSKLDLILIADSILKAI